MHREARLAKAEMKDLLPGGHHLFDAIVDYQCGGGW
jgi:hypothetical protein